MVLFLANSSLYFLLLGAIAIFGFTLFLLIINIYREIKKGSLENEILILFAGLIICFILPIILGLFNELPK